MEVQVLGHARPKAWRGLGERTGNTVCIPYKRRRRGSGCVKYSRTVVICSSGSDRGETLRRRRSALRKIVFDLRTTFLDSLRVRGAWGSLLVFAITPSPLALFASDRPTLFVGF